MLNATQNAALRPHPAAALSRLAVTVGELADAQDAALMQILAMARLARGALDSETENAVADVGFALDAIMRIAAAANADLDATQIDIGDARLAIASCAGPESQFGRVAPV